MLGVSAAFAAADHIQIHDTPQDQSAMSAQEFQSHQKMDSYVQTGSSYDNVTALWLSSLTLNLFADEIEPRTIRGGAEATRGGIVVEEGLFIYRQQWSEYYVTKATPELQLTRLVVGDRWLHNAVASEHKVYSTGETGIVWSPERRVFSPGNNE
jgi:hypothetical protein